MEAAAAVQVDSEGKRSKYLAKYGYPRLVGTKGIFYADQVSLAFEGVSTLPQ